MSRTGRPLPIGWAPVAAAALVAALLVNLADSRPLSQHEALVAETAREMARSGDLVLPRFCGEPRLEKPPLAYWAALTAAGVDRVERVRVPFALAGLGLVGLVAWWVRGRLGARVAIAAAATLGTSYFVVVQARLAEADIVLALAVAAAILSSTELERPGRPVFFWAALGLGFLAKGPVVFVHVLPAVLLDRALRRDARGLRRLASAGPALLFVGLAALWPIAAAVRHPAAWDLWWAESAGRFLADPGGTERPAWYYAIAAAWTTLPWSPLAAWWLARRYARRGGIGRWRADRVDTLALAWLIGPIAALSLSAGKQEHYAFPALVPIAIWGARGLVLVSRWVSRRSAAVRAIRPLAAEGLGVGVLAAAVALWHVAVIPALAGHRPTARWIAATGGGDAVLVGHEVRWLAPYHGVPPAYDYSIEALLDRLADSGGSETIVTTRRVLDQATPWLDATDLLEGPIDRGMPGDRRVVRARVRLTDNASRLLAGRTAESPLTASNNGESIR